MGIGEIDEKADENVYLDFANPRIIDDSTFHIYAISDLKSWNDLGKILLIHKDNPFMDKYLKTSRYDILSVILEIESFFNDSLKEFDRCLVKFII